MSRRREAAELARVLLLSTQQAQFAADNGPHTLSSPHGTGHGHSTIDSRDMEIRVMEPGAAGLGVDPRMIMGPPGSWNMQGGGTDSSQSGSGGGGAEVMEGETGVSSIEQPIPTVPRSNSSTIQPFTPTAPSVPAEDRGALVPNSSGAPPPAAQPIIQTPASIPPSAARPNGSRSSGKRPIEGTPASGPLFSPTQGSRRNMQSNPSDDAPATGDGSPPRPAVKHQYTRFAPPPITEGIPNNVEKAGSSSRPVHLSSSPDIPTALPQLPLPVKPVKAPRRSRTILDFSDDDMYDPSADRRPAKSAKVTPATKAPKERARSKSAFDLVDRAEGRESPDPLLLGDEGFAKVSKPKAKPRISAAAKGKGKEKAREDAAPTSQEKGAGGVEGPKRISSRVKDKEAKEEAEKIERRRKRAEEKDRLAKEAAAKLVADGGPSFVVERKEGSTEEVLVIRDEEEVAAEVDPLLQAVKAAAPAEVAIPKPIARPAIRRILSSSPAPADPIDDVRPSTGASTNAMRRILSSSPGPTETIIVVQPEEEAAPVTIPPLGRARAATVDSDFNDDMSEPAKSPAPSPVKKVTAKKAATQAKKMAAAAKKAEKAASKAKAAPKEVFKSKEFIEESEDEEGAQMEGAEAAAAPARPAVKEIAESFRPEAVEAEISKAAASSKKTPAKKGKPTPKAAAAAETKRVLESDHEEEEMEEDADKAMAGPSTGPGTSAAVPSAPAPVRKPSPPVGRRPMPALSVSPEKEGRPARQPLTAVPPRLVNGASTSSPRHSPGPMSEKGTPLRPDGIKFKTERNDLASVLSKFPKSRFAGMSNRLRIAPLHSKIGPPKKELPPPPKKAEKRKKGDSDEDDDDDEEEEDEDGVMRKKKKERGMEWYMVED